MHALGPLILVGLIAYAFGHRTAQAVVGAVLIAGVLAFAYVMWRVIEGTI